MQSLDLGQNAKRNSIVYFYLKLIHLILPSFIFYLEIRIYIKVVLITPNKQNYHTVDKKTIELIKKISKKNYHTFQHSNRRLKASDAKPNDRDGSRKE